MYVPLTHWTELPIYASENKAIIDSDSGLLPARRRAIIWTNECILLIWPLGINFIEIKIEIQIFSFKKMYLKMSSGKCRPYSPRPQCVKNMSKIYIHDISVRCASVGHVMGVEFICCCNFSWCVVLCVIVITWPTDILLIYYIISSQSNVKNNPSGAWQSGRKMMEFSLIYT